MLTKRMCIAARGAQTGERKQLDLIVVAQARFQCGDSTFRGETRNVSVRFKRFEPHRAHCFVTGASNGWSDRVDGDDDGFPKVRGRLRATVVEIHPAHAEFATISGRTLP